MMNEMHTTMNPPKSDSWQKFLEEQEALGYLQPIRDFLRDAYAHRIVYPAKENIFAALEKTPMDQVKVVILGQDPYHGPNQAQGFSFSVPEGVRIPPSLQNIYKEIALEYPQCAPLQRSGDLSDWASQGVLLLNAILTVEAGQPLSHEKIGWQRFTDAILQKLNTLDQPIVFLLWGSKARAARRFLNNPRHLVLETVHPSPLSANRGFFGCGQFRKANEFLESHGVSGIDWCASNLPRH